jgi:hypothetical protein
MLNSIGITLYIKISFFKVLKITPLFFFIYIFSIQNSFAVSKTFLATNGNWSVAANWSPAGVPATGDDVVIPAGKTAVVFGNITMVPLRSLIVVGFLDLTNNGKIAIEIFLYSESAGHIFANSSNEQLRIGSIVYNFNEINTITGSTGNPAVLPVKLSKFSSEKSQNSIALKWSTSFESNFKNFEVQKSRDGKSFENIGTIDPEKNALYTFNDPKPSLGLSYYRLQINDLDGSVTYSKIIAVNYNVEHISLAYPNPSQDKSVHIDVPFENASIEVFSITGQKVPYTLEASNDHTKIIIPNNFSNMFLYLSYKKEGRKYTEKIFFE